MENPTVSGLRSRSRSKTPFLRSSCDHENCTETEEHTHKSGRKTPIKRSTPIKEISQATKIPEKIPESTEEISSPPAYRTRRSMKQTEVHTSDYSSEDGMDRLRHQKEIFQNEINNQYERVSTSSHHGYSALDDVTLSPIQTSFNLIADRSKRFGSPAASICSTDSSFAEQALADTSTLLNYNPNNEHLPSRLYKMAGEYWNKYPKTDYTYSPLSKDRVELAPGQVAMPNMSRRSLTQFRIQGPNVSADEVDRLAATSAWTTSTLRKRYTTCRHVVVALLDYTYSPLSKDRVELAPGQVAMPNMSRRSLTQFRIQGPNVSAYEVDRLAATSAWTTSTLRKRYTSLDSSDDEIAYQEPVYSDQRWWITRMLLTMITAVTTASGNAYRRVVGPSHRYPYTDRRPKESIVSRTATVAASPFLWIYTLVKQVITTTITTVTETITPNHVAQTETYIGQPATVAKRRWWPWMLLLLLPAVCYGCYNYSDNIELPNLPSFKSQEQPVYADTYKSPQILQDPDLTKRVAALEDWALNVDSKLKFFDQKLSKVDNLEEQIEQYSFKYLQQNLIQVFNTENTEVLAEKLKGYFDKYYMTSDQLQTLSREVHERLISTWRPDMDEDTIRRLIQEYLSVFEKKQMEILSERLQSYVREVEVHHTGSGFDIEAVKRVVTGMLNVYDADKTGMVDFALESAGGQVISTKCTELYQIKTKQYSILGLPVWWVYTSPRYALTPGAAPAECWAFQGFPGYLVVRTYAIIEVTGFSLEHMSRLLAVEGKIESAPKNFSVYGLHGEQDPEPHLFGDYMYESNGTAIQYFPVKHPKTTLIGGVAYPVAYDIIELRVESNHGNPTYTCVYRFRVHGNALTDIRQATEDSILDSEL